MKQSSKVIREEFVAAIRGIEEFMQVEEASELLEAGNNLETAAMQVGRAWCGSWIGYHARVYYSGLRQPPSEAFFDRQWGLQESYSNKTSGEWGIYNANDIKEDVCRSAGVAELDSSWWPSVQKMRAYIKDAKDALLSCFLVHGEMRKDPFMDRLQKAVEATEAISTRSLIEHLRPSGQFYSLDSDAILEGIVTPPHIVVMCQALEIKAVVTALDELIKAGYKAVGHIDKFSFMTHKPTQSGQKIFIGHGRSSLWRELKDFISDRLHLQWDEFNRVPVAGTTTISRLESMLEDAAFAFLVMTAEDELTDALRHPRLNVVHEAGLFQARLGFSRAIVLLEEGCAEFSNIVGLTQIRFPKGNIKACFEEVRQVLERERLVEL